MLCGFESHDPHGVWIAVSLVLGLVLGTIGGAVAAVCYRRNLGGAVE